MQYTIITTQKDSYGSFLKTGLVARALKKKIIDVKLESLYDYAEDSHRSIDDSPYGGGAGMVLKVDVIDKALSKLKGRKILLTPQGKRFTQKDATRLAKLQELILISGRFEGFDERIRGLVDEEISIGDYVLTSGELAAMVLIEAISRQIPGFIDRKESIQSESFSLKIGNSKIENCLEYPQYTRPFEYTPRQARTKRSQKVPKILISGNHGQVESWRKAQAEKKTAKIRPDLSN